MRARGLIAGTRRTATRASAPRSSTPAGLSWASIQAATPTRRTASTSPGRGPWPRGPSTGTVGCVSERGEAGRASGGRAGSGVSGAAARGVPLGGPGGGAAEHPQRVPSTARASHERERIASLDAGRRRIIPKPRSWTPGPHPSLLATLGFAVASVREDWGGRPGSARRSSGLRHRDLKADLGQDPRHPLALRSGAHPDRGLPLVVDPPRDRHALVVGAADRLHALRGDLVEGVAVAVPEERDPGWGLDRLLVGLLLHHRMGRG